MELPIRFLESRTDERVVSVDGAWGQPGLNLSHWPGNATPRELRHDLSTGVVLKFQRLPEARRAELERGCTALANNHYDTDGVCALFAARHPARALAVEDALLALARAGDFFALPDERSFQLDRIVTRLVDADESPWAGRFRGLADGARREFVMRELVETFDEFVTGSLEPWADLWRADLERLRADRAALAAASRDEIAHLQLTIWTARDERLFDPGRHALLGGTDSDRVLAIGERRGGATYRLVIGTASWFDLESPRPLPRPALEDLVTRLNALEGTRASDAVAWRCQPTDSPSPELWFGRRDHAFFAEHAPVLEASRLAPNIVRPAVLDALRATWTFPDDDSPVG